MPVYLVGYPGNTPPASTHIRFNNLCQQAGIEGSARIVLAHARTSARYACGLGAETEGGDSKVARIARATGTYHASATSGRAREACLASVEAALLELMGKYDEQSSIARLAEQYGINRRWLRRMALTLISQLQPTCMASDDGRLAWVAALRDRVVSLGIALGAGVSVNAYFRMPPRPEWSQFLQPSSDLAAIKWATIHEAKGSEHGAVCVIIPSGEYTEELIAAWESRAASEAKRVIYVGVTRAEKLLVIALPVTFMERVATIMEEGDVPFEIHDFAVLSEGSDSQAEQASSCVP